MDFETTQWLRQQFTTLVQKQDAVAAKVEFLDQKLDALRSSVATRADLERVQNGIEQVQIGIDSLSVQVATKSDLDKLASADDLHKVMTAMDHIAKQYDDHGQDHELADGQLEQHSRWIKQLADKTGVKLSEA